MAMYMDQSVVLGYQASGHMDHVVLEYQEAEHMDQAFAEGSLV